MLPFFVILIHHPHPHSHHLFPHCSSSSSSSQTLSLLLLLSSLSRSSSSSPLAFIVWMAKAGTAKKEAKMHLKLQASVQVSTTLFLATCGVVRLLLLIRGQFLEGAREGGDESPFKKCPLTSQKPRRSQSAASHDGNISSVDCCVARKISTRGSRRQKLGGASYDTFSVQYQKNNFYL